MHLSWQTDQFGALSEKIQPRQSPRADGRLSVGPKTRKIRRASDDGCGPAAHDDDKEEGPQSS